MSREAAAPQPPPTTSPALEQEAKWLETACGHVIGPLITSSTSRRHEYVHIFGASTSTTILHADVCRHKLVTRKETTRGGHGDVHREGFRARSALAPPSAETVLPPSSSSLPPSSSPEWRPSASTLPSCRRAPRRIPAMAAPRREPPPEQGRPRLHTNS